MRSVITLSNVGNLSKVKGPTTIDSLVPNALLIKTKTKRNADDTTLSAVLLQRCWELLAFLCTTSESKRKFSMDPYWMQNVYMAWAMVQTQQFSSVWTTETFRWETDASPVDCHLLTGWHDVKQVPVTQGLPLVMYLTNNGCLRVN